jgi:hypothetical protein
MIDYTERITLLMRDLIVRVPRLSYIDPGQLLVFGRYGRHGAVGPYATCHCLTLPTSEPGYYYWRDRQSGNITRRSRWFVTKTPSVVVSGRQVHYMISFALPRFCDQSLVGSRKEQYYDGAAPWIAKLDTIAHELYHIDPQAAGIRRVERADGGASSGSHGRTFLGTVAGMVKEYLASGPDPDVYDFLQYSFDELNATYGGVVGTTFRTFPSYPQRYIELLPASAQPETPKSVRIQALRTPAGPTSFGDADLMTRQFLEGATRHVARREPRRNWNLLRQIELPQGAEIERAAAGSCDAPSPATHSR